MIKLIVIARCIPEDIYLRSLEQTVPILAGEKKFSIVIRDPENWYIGRLANEIKTRYESLYKRQFGQIKYLKDAEDDCDLDPELLVTDLLVDEGRAARDGADQKRIVKVIQEQGRSLRQGSVVPDLTPLHYQPPTKPPVPRFPGLEKHVPDETNNDARPPKRRRLDQIEEDHHESIARSIEGTGAIDRRNALNDPNGDLAGLEPKQESPETNRAWTNRGLPPTTDELEVLPQKPDDFQQRQQQTHRSSHEISGQAAQGIGASTTPQGTQGFSWNNDRSGQRDKVGPLADRIAKQHSLADARTAITPPYPAATAAAQTPATQTVNMLNGMKSASPVMRQPNSSSANRFRKSRSDMYDVPESDIDDSQMSPNSRAARARITPKLVQTPQPRNNLKSSAGLSRLSSAKQNASNPENQTSARCSSPQLPPSRRIPELNRVDARPKPNSISSRQQLKRLDDMQAPEPGSGPKIDDHGSTLGSGETWSLHEDGTRTKRRKRSRNSRERPRSDADMSTSRSSSAASVVSNSNATQQQKERKRLAPTKIRDQRGEGDEDMDSPGAQLSKNLEESSPKRRSKSTSASKSRGSTMRQSGMHRKTGKQHQEDDNEEGEEEHEGNEDEDGEDVTRPPDSISDDEEVVPAVRQPEPRRAAQKSSKKPKGVSDVILKCYTCWRKPANCDNQRPKCSFCERCKKTCQLYDLTKEAFEEEKARRDTANTAKKSTSKTKSVSKPRAKVLKKPLQSGEASASDEESKDELSAGAKHLASGEQKETATTKESRSIRRIVVDVPQRVLPETAQEAPTTQRYSSEASHATAKSHVLPPGMTQDQYDQHLKDNEGLTNEQRLLNKMAAKKSNQRNRGESSPLVARSQSSQDLADQSRKRDASMKSDERIASSTQISSKRSGAPSAARSSKVPESTDHISTPTVARPPSPKTAPPKMRPVQPVVSSTTTKSKLKTHPTIATTAAAMNGNRHENTPYRVPRLSLPTKHAVSDTTGMSGKIPTSLAQLRAQQKSNAGSGASTPNSGAAVPKTFAITSKTQQKKGVSIGSSDDDSDDDDSDDTTGDNGDPYKGLLTGAGQVTVRHRQAVTSDDSDDE